MKLFGAFKRRAKYIKLPIPSEYFGGWNKSIHAGARKTEKAVEVNGMIIPEDTFITPVFAEILQVYKIVYYFQVVYNNVYCFLPFVLKPGSFTYFL